MTFEIEDGNYLAHYGVLRRSGRYPWGSGGPEEASNNNFLGYVAKLKKEGLSDTEIARGMGISTTELRAAKSVAKNEQKAADIAHAQSLKEHGYSNVEIGKKMARADGTPLNESSVRALLAPGQAEKTAVLTATSDMLEAAVKEKTFIDIGTGVEHHVGVSRTKLDNAVAQLKEKGYEVHRVQVDQLGTNNKTTIKVLCPPGTTYRDLVTRKGDIQQARMVSDDGGLTYDGFKPPLNVNSKRLAINYDEDGGSQADGVIYVRPGKDDVSLGNSRYAQVRIAVDGTHYLKGMAIYKDDLPDGVDLVFNTNKKKADIGDDKLAALKKMKDDPDNPFGAVVRQIKDNDRNVTSAMNIVNEEGRWDDWSKNLSSQMLSKQSPTLAKGQLDLTYERRKRELDEIMGLTNPAVKKKLLESYADGADSAAVHLKAAALPRQRTQVILPVPAMKDGEIYAPNFRDGERVALVRFPHGGVFEIPELTVNNRNPAAKRLLGDAKDAVGINHKVAERLSGADFDGDTVLVIPNNHGQVKTAPALKGLVDFDPKVKYKAYEGMAPMTARQKGHQMGLVSNLITDMTIKGANNEELARAVRHSMVVIDAEKHNLNYKQSAVDNGISSLMKKYQDRSGGGSATLISRATARQDILERKPRSAANGGPVDKATGKKVYEETGNSWQDAKGNTVFATQRSVKLAETDDANTLSSGTAIEKVYATHSNRLKGLADQARQVAVNTPPVRISDSAKKAYSPQVASLNAKLNLAIQNKPLERQAQVIANATVQAKKDANPNLEPAELKKVKAQALDEARARTGAKKAQIDLTPDEWAAIQAGAISNNKLDQILDNADLDKVKALATPREQVLMTATAKSRATSMAASGYTQAEIADALGVSVSTLKAAE